MIHADSMDTDETLGFGAGIGIGIAMIVCTIAIMGTMILALLIFCVRRKQRKGINNYQSSSNTDMYVITSLFISCCCK